MFFKVYKIIIKSFISRRRLALCQWKTLLEEKTLIVKLGESQHRTIGNFIRGFCMAFCSRTKIMDCFNSTGLIACALSWVLHLPQVKTVVLFQSCQWQTYFAVSRNLNATKTKFNYLKVEFFWRAIRVEDHLHLRHPSVSRSKTFRRRELSHCRRTDQLLGRGRVADPSGKFPRSVHHFWGRIPIRNLSRLFRTKRLLHRAAFHDEIHLQCGLPVPEIDVLVHIKIYL